MADNEFGNVDVVVLGTGLKESILSGILSVSGKKVLHLDRNNYYGGESASLNLDQLFKKFRDDGATPPQSLGKSSAYAIDLCPKFLMACGDLVGVLLSAKVTDYLEFRSVSGSYVYSKDGKVRKVPTTVGEAMTCGMLGLIEINRYRVFLNFNEAYDANNPKTHKTPKGNDVHKITAGDLYKEFKLAKDTITFTGHAVALHPDEKYQAEPAVDLVNRAKLYAYSVSRYGNSPYIYPRYGLGGLPEGFSRRCAVFGGTFMLNMSNAHPFIQQITYDDAGVVTGLQLGADVCKAYDIPDPMVTCKQLVADPSYFIETDKVKQTSQIARCIVIMSKPIPNTNEDSAQIIMPGTALGRKTDIYVCMTSWNHSIAADGKYVAVMSCTMEIEGGPEANLAPALKLLPEIDEKFVWVSDFYEPTGDGAKDQCFITSSMDATTHFQSSMGEVMGMYKRITGKDYEAPPAPEPAAE